MPNRRFIDSGLYLPSIRSEGIDTIAVIVDTSGSLPAATLAAFWAELREIATELQPERVILLQVDADAAISDVHSSYVRPSPRQASTTGSATPCSPTSCAPAFRAGAWGKRRCATPASSPR